MRTVVFQLVGEMEQYADDIENFTRLMIGKLEKNVHKGRWEGMIIPSAFALMLAEVKELRMAIENGEDIEAIVKECADVANFAMIIASITQDKGNE